MKNNNLRKIISGAVLLVLCAATIAGVYFGICGRNVTYATIHTESGDTEQPLDRQVAFIPNTINTTWQQAIRPEAKLGGGYSYTLALEGADSDTLKAAARVMRDRAELISGNADSRVEDDTVVVSVPQDASNTTLATILATTGVCDFAPYDTEAGAVGESVMTADAVSQAYYSNNNSTYAVQVKFTGAGEKQLKQLQQNGVTVLYLRLDGSPVGYAYVSSLSKGMLTFTANDASTAFLAVCCLRAGSLPAAATLKAAAPAAATSGSTITVIILLCAFLALITCAAIVFLCRAKGLVAVWAVVGWIVLFSLALALIAVSTSWIMTSLSMTVLVICLISFLYGLAALYGSVAKELKAGRGTLAAYNDACRKQLKFLSILYGAILLIGVLLMAIFRAAAYGILGRFISLSALISFVMLFIGIRIVLVCLNSLKARR